MTTRLARQCSGMDEDAGLATAERLRTPQRLRLSSGKCEGCCLESTASEPLSVLFHRCPCGMPWGIPGGSVAMSTAGVDNVTDTRERRRWRERHAQGSRLRHSLQKSHGEVRKQITEGEIVARGVLDGQASRGSPSLPTSSRPVPFATRREGHDSVEADGTGLA
ncbi:hypothetical protein FA10DRAFT_201384 [Acaromyces ingoldii]|uniref:Uncharacterized protein n=1 Tax=Acaromyces ingoldii TaxID=215250 RepID=A0A316YGJ2_9BASI|nr:hypothetical protein FA10DRAFT_201384 [Acaromyces ingoldii]PWN86855.1 hypothetical protein FA10DRAFT_201384 [Acaromyces ingoldii]